MTQRPGRPRTFMNQPRRRAAAREKYQIQSQESIGGFYGVGASRGYGSKWGTDAPDARPYGTAAKQAGGSFRVGRSVSEIFCELAEEGDLVAAAPGDDDGEEEEAGEEDE